MKYRVRIDRTYHKGITINTKELMKNMDSETDRKNL